MVNFRLHFNCIYNIFATVHHKAQRAKYLVLIIDVSYIPHLKGARGWRILSLRILTLKKIERFVCLKKKKKKV